MTSAASAALLLLATLPMASSAATTTINCNSGGNLQSALDAASPGDVVRVRGTCVGNFRFMKGGWSSQPAVILRGAGDGPTLKGAGGATDPVLLLEGNLRVVNLAITGGGGHGIQLSTFGGELQLVDALVTHNAGDGVVFGTDFPGEMLAVGSKFLHNGGYGIRTTKELTVRDSIVAHNGAGGIMNAVQLSSMGDLRLIRSKVMHNDGRGITNRGRAIVRNSQIKGNRTSGRGGGILDLACGMHEWGGLTLVDSVVTKNTAATGGGIYHEQDGYSYLRIRSSVIDRNSPDDIVREQVTGCL